MSASATRKSVRAFRCWHAGRRPELKMSIWANAVINAPEAFKNDFRIITMDQRNATGGESTGPVPVESLGAFADDQLGLMDHLGIRQFRFSATASAVRLRSS